MKRTTILLASALLAGPAFAADDPGIDPSGYLYGTVETESGNSYTGFLRWGREEAFWDDHFNGGKSELPFASSRPREEREERSVKVFGVRISYGSDHSVDRHFVARFGDIREIEPSRRGARVTMRDGQIYEIDDSSNDIGATITVDDSALGHVKLDWEKIERVRFAAAPDGARPAAWRLTGKLETRGGTFTGPIQWDLEECLSTDELNGETRDGDVDIEMGKIRSIERNDRNGAWVTLDDGRRLLVEDTNDVDHTTSGIFVEDARFGRVKVSWAEFVRVDFTSDGGSGRGYSAYPTGKALRGKVTDTDGDTFTGRIVFDLDEDRDWEILDGENERLEYSIPFAMVSTIVPGRSGAQVVLKNGETLFLEDTQDVSEDNDGVVVLTGEDRSGERYLPWRRVERIDFD